jgi:hypothetical protein
MEKINICIILLQEGKKVHTGGGFSGKGFKFDEAEAMMVSEKKKFQKAALGNIFSFFIKYLLWNFCI